jgi:hypothetical protein
LHPGGVGINNEFNEEENGGREMSLDMWKYFKENY